jgi:hypothetical protein
MIDSLSSDAPSLFTVIGLLHPLNHSSPGLVRLREDETKTTAVAVPHDFRVMGSAVWTFLKTQIDGGAAAAYDSYHDEGHNAENCQKQECYNDLAEVHEHFLFNTGFWCSDQREPRTQDNNA